MVTGLTVAERQLALVVLGMLALAGLAMAVAGRGDPLAVHGFDQGAMLLTARRHPAAGLLLRGAAFGKGFGGQRRLELVCRRRPAGAQAVEHQILEHGWCELRFGLRETGILAAAHRAP